MAARQLPPIDVLRQLLTYDPENGHLLWRSRPQGMFSRSKDCLTWNARFSGKQAGTLTPRGYLKVTINSEKFWAHRIAWKMHHGIDPAFEIDHVNRVKNDNRAINLRDVEPRVNSKNTPLLGRNTSGVTGVFWNSQRGRWHAKIRSDGRDHHLGFFHCIVEAVAARKAAERRFGFHINHGRSV